MGSRYRLGAWSIGRIDNRRTLPPAQEGIRDVEQGKRFDIKTLSSLRLSAEVNPMGETARRSTIYFDPELHRSLRIKAADTRCTMSDLVNDAVRAALREDQEDLAAFDERAGEPTMSYEALLKDLRRHGRLFTS